MMNTILLIFLLGQFDMSGHDDLMMAGDVRAAQVLDMAGQSERRRLDLYAPSWCPHCKVAKQEIKTLKGFQVQVHEDYDKFPDWILRQGLKSGWGYPLVHWELPDGTGKVAVWPGIAEFQKADGKAPLPRKDNSEFAPTPGREVERVIELLPKPEIGFVDFGCGDGRWCIAAAERWGCRVTGIEIDPARAAAAKERVRLAGLSHLVTIVEGDVLQTEVEADVGVAYLYTDVLEKLKPRLEKLKAFASYKHRPPGLPVVKNGETWFYVRPVARPQSAVWGNQYYTQPVCNDPGCAMCNSIRRQLNQGMPNPPRGSVWRSLF